MTREKPNTGLEIFLIPSVDGLRVHAKLLQSCLTFCDPVNCSLPGLSVHGNSPGKNIAVGLPCSPARDLLNPGIEPRSPAFQVDSLPSEPPREPRNIGVGSLYLLQGIFPTEDSNWGLLHCRWILYQLSRN